MRNAKYSILLMRDDSRVRRLRLSPLGLRILSYGLLLLLLTSAAALMAVAAMWEDRQSLLEARKKAESQLVESRIQLDRLRHIESVLNSGDLSEIQDRMELQAAAGGQAGAKADPQPLVNLSELFAKVDLKQAKIDALQAKLADDKLKLAFDLGNLTPAQPLSGQLEIHIVTNEGVLLRLSLTDAEANFQIQRQKKVQASLSLPKALDRSRLFALRLVINNASGAVILAETYPLAALLS